MRYRQITFEERYTLGLIRQYLPKGRSMKHLMQHDNNAIAR